MIRKWVKKSKISDSIDRIDIWDSGSHIYERWPNNKDIYWKVMKRELTEQGFEETLLRMPIWETPFQVMNRDQIPFRKLSDLEYEIGHWVVSLSEPMENMKTKEDKVSFEQGSQVRPGRNGSHQRGVQQAQKALRNVHSSSQKAFLEVPPKVSPTQKAFLEVPPKVSPTQKAFLEVPPKVSPTQKAFLEVPPKVSPTQKAFLEVQTKNQIEALQPSCLDR
jgi:hypothetical protein